MKFFEWWGEPDVVDVDFPIDEFRGYWMLEGRAVSGWDATLTAVYRGPTQLTSHFGLADNGWPVFSSRMRQLLEVIAPGAVQFLPFRLILGETQDQLPGFCVGQVLKRIDCLDRERTKVRSGKWHPINDRGDFGVYRPIVLRRSPIQDQKLFRINGHCRSIVIRQDLKEMIEAAGFAGQRFDLLDIT